MRDLITLIENQEVSPALLRLNKLQASLKKNGFVKNNNRYVLNKDDLGIIVSLNWQDGDIQVFFTLLKKNMIVTQRWFDDEKINGWRREYGGDRNWKAQQLSDESGKNLDEVSFIEALAANPQRFVDKSFAPVRAKQATLQSLNIGNMSSEQPETRPASPAKLAAARATWDRHQVDIDKASEKLRELKQIQRDTWSEIMGHPRKK